MNKIDEIIDKFPKACFDFENNPEVLKVTERIKGLDWFFVGGIVRDSLLGIKTKDVDITTTATPEEVISCLAGFNLNTIGQRFGTIGVFLGEWKIEITTTREDMNQDGRHTEVKLQVSFEDDCSRRDFTFNSLLYRENKIIDYTGGLEDLRKRQINFINEPHKRITEDYLRMIRYVRFCVRYGYNTIITQEIKDMFNKNLNGLKKISIERIINEIQSMANYSHTWKAIELLNLFGISKTVFGHYLYADIPEEFDVFKKLSIIFKDLPDCLKLPLPKKTKSLLEVYLVNRGSVLDNIAYLWYKKSKEIAKLYIDFISNYENNEEFEFLNSIEWHINTDHLKDIIGPSRTTLELEKRKSYIMDLFNKKKS